MNDEILDKAVWHILAQQMTHAINCEDPKHRKAMSCVAFTAGAHVEMMQLIKEDRERAVREALIDELEHMHPASEYVSKGIAIPAFERLYQLSNLTQEKEGE